jgi:hypothetical protein
MSHRLFAVRDRHDLVLTQIAPCPRGSDSGERILNLNQPENSPAADGAPLTDHAHSLRNHGALFQSLLHYLISLLRP